MTLPYLYILSHTLDFRNNPYHSYLEGSVREKNLEKWWGE